MDPTLPSKKIGGGLIEAGASIGEYVVSGVLGEGGFGVVYAAQHPLIGKKVAIKVLALRYSVDPEILSRFISEARAVNQIGHENIIDIFAFGELDDGRRYYVMEHLDGLPLDEHLRQAGALQPEEAAQIMLPIARALDAAHATGIAHRDLKPANVFLAWREGGWFPKLLDFGIAKLMGEQLPKDHQTQTGAAVGTPFYMSPEQCMGREVDHRTDHYAFGVMAYQMLTGELPFTAATTVEILMKHINDQPPTIGSKLQVTNSIEQGILRLMSKLPEERPASVSSAVRDMFPELGPPSSSTPPAFTPVPAAAMSAPAITEFPVSSDVETPSGGGRSLWRIGLIAALLAAAVVGAALYKKQMDAAKRVEATPVESSPKTPPPDVVPAAAPEPAMVQLKLSGAPKGAMISRPDGTQLGKSPVRLPRGTKPVRLVVSASGYQDLKIEVTPDRDLEPHVSLDKKLVRKTRRRPPPKAAPPPPTRPKKPKTNVDELPSWE